MADTQEYWMVVGFIMVYTITIFILGFIGVGSLETECGTLNTDSGMCAEGVSFTEGFSSIFVNPFKAGSWEALIMILVFLIPTAIISTLVVINIARGR